MTRRMRSDELFAALDGPAPDEEIRRAPSPPRQESEAHFTTWVIDTARWYGWRAAHFRPAQTRSGRWATAMQGDIGVPDVLLARDGEVILAELKSDTGRLRPEQHAWLAALGPSAAVWRPRDREAVLARLSALRTRKEAR